MKYQISSSRRLILALVVTSSNAVAQAKNDAADSAPTAPEATQPASPHDSGTPALTSLNSSTTPQNSPAPTPTPGPAAPTPGPAATTPAATTPAATTPAATTPATPVTAGLPPPVPTRFRPPKLGWDVNLEGAYGRYFPEHERFGFARFRGGLLYSVDPIYYALGLTYDWSNLDVATFGVQAEAMQIEAGVWLQLGAVIDSHAHPGATAAVGWSIVGAEVQLRKFDPGEYGFALVGKIRIPITFIAKAF